MKIMEKVFLKRGEIAVNKKRLTAHTLVVKKFIENIDILMKQSESFERGKKISQLVNGLEFSNDTVRHFELNIPFKKILKKK